MLVLSLDRGRERDERSIFLRLHLCCFLGLSDVPTEPHHLGLLIHPPRPSRLWRPKTQRLFTGEPVTISISATGCFRTRASLRFC